MTDTPTHLSLFREKHDSYTDGDTGSSNYTWDGVEREAYTHGQKYEDGEKTGQKWQGVIRQVLIGNQIEATRFHVRYFEVLPGGYSSLEKHQHAHVVIVIRGHGKAVLDATAHEILPFDSVYVAPWTPHQFLALGDEPFGFFCVVDAERDRPQSVSPIEHDCAVRAGAVSGR